MQQGHGRGLLGVTIIGMLIGSVAMMYVPTKAADSVVVQQNEFPRNLTSQPGVAHYQFILALFARRYAKRVEVRYSFLALDTQVNLSRLNMGSERFGDLSDSIADVAWLLEVTKDYPVKPEVLDVRLSLDGEEHGARIYDFSGILPSSVDPAVSEEALTTHMALFGEDGRILKYYSGISDFVDQEGTLLELVSVTITQGTRRDVYYSGEVPSGEDARPIGERPLMGVARFDKVDRGSTVSVVCNTKYAGGRKVECLQLIRIYVDGRIDRLVANPITVLG